MIGNFFGGKNSFYGIGDSAIYNTLKNTEISSDKHKFDYSNFGYAALGLILEKVTGTEFTRLCDDYLHDELGLANSRISDGNGDLGKLWDWQPGDTYMSAGAILSDIEDMLKYAQMQLDGFSENHESLAVVDTVNENYQKMGINMDEIGAAWLIDRENGFVWHNGGTGNYNSYLGFCEETKTAVVVLSNLAPSYKIPATVLGLKKLQSLQ
ncbi:MAG: serine hydrolase domain-containing protein, partial [Oscillospiraceae bacterium]